MMESPDFGQRDDLSAFSLVCHPWIGRILVEREMRPCAVVVARVVREHSAEMPLVENDYVA